jgi:hypothetical protein
MPLFIHVFNVFSTFSGNSVGARGHFFAHLVAKKLQRGLQFLVIFLAIFDYFAVQKRFDFVAFLTTFGGPRPPRDTKLTTWGVKKCVFLLDLQNATKHIAKPKFIFHRQAEMELNFRNRKPKCGQKKYQIGPKISKKCFDGMCRLRSNALTIGKRPTNYGAPNVCERLPKNAASKQKTIF